MPTLDPGFTHYIKSRMYRRATLDIRTTERGWEWVTENEIHELTVFGTVHVKQHRSR